MSGCVVTVGKFQFSDEALAWYEQQMAIGVAAFLEMHYGERCKDFEASCVCCRRWHAFDLMFRDANG